MNGRRSMLQRCSMGVLLAAMVPGCLRAMVTEAKGASVPEALQRAITLHKVAVTEFIKGNIGPWKAHCSHRDDVTIVGGWGGFEKGWGAQVEKRYEWAVARFAGAESAIEFENISLLVTPELAYSVDIERSRVQLAGREDFAPMALRVTTIFRLENGEWKMVHRHADPLVDVQSAGSVVKK